MAAMRDLYRLRDLATVRPRKLSPPAAEPHLDPPWT